MPPAPRGDDAMLAGAHLQVWIVCVHAVQQPGRRRHIVHCGVPGVAPVPAPALQHARLHASACLGWRGSTMARRASNASADAATAAEQPSTATRSARACGYRPA